MTYEANRQHTIENIIKDALYSDPVIKEFISDFITSYHDNIPGTVIRNGEALNWLIDSVKVYHIQNGGDPGKHNSQWKWYIFTPTRDQDQVVNWTKRLLQLPIRASVYGYGEVLDHHKCARCKSRNHEANECPFTKRSQFIPTPTTPKVTGNNTRGGTRGRGRNRGRGSRRAREE